LVLTQLLKVFILALSFQHGLHVICATLNQQVKTCNKIHQMGFQEVVILVRKFRRLGFFFMTVFLESLTAQLCAARDARLPLQSSPNLAVKLCAGH
jgi:hypothetical protein